MADTTTGLILDLPLEEAAGVPVDQTGNNPGITLLGPTVWNAAGKSGNCIAFAGASFNQIIIPHQAIQQPTTLSVAAWWLFGTPLVAFETLASKQANDGANGYPNWSLYTYTDASINATVNVGGTTYTASTGAAAIVPNGTTWYHIGFSFGANALKLFINGVQVATNTAMSGSLAQLAPVPIGIGCSNSFPTGREMTGKVDSFKMYNRALAAADWAALAGSTHAAPAYLLLIS